MGESFKVIIFDMHNLVVFIYNSQCSTYWPIEVEVKCVDKHRSEERLQKRPKRYPTHNQSEFNVTNVNVVGKIEK